MFEHIPLHGAEVVLNSVPCGSGIFMKRMQPSVSLPRHLFLILVCRYEAFDSITVCIGCVATRFLSPKVGSSMYPVALFWQLHRLICHLKLCSDIMYSSYSSSYQYCLHKFLPVCLPSQIHNCTVYSATVAPQMSFNCASLICSMCCGECKIKNSRRNGECLHSCVLLHSLPYFLKIKL